MKGLNSEELLRRHIFDYVWLVFFAGLIITADQVTKALVRTNLPLQGVWAPWPWLMPYARIVHWYNTGVAFGMFQGMNTVFMILAIIVSVVQPLVSTWTLPADPEFDQCMILALGALAIAALAWHAPSVAGGMLAGSPSLTAGTAVGATMALGAGAYYGGQVFSRTTAGIASAGRTGASATRAAVNYLNK